MNRFIKADEVAEELGISKPYAYKIIRRLNEELREKGTWKMTSKSRRKRWR